MTDGGNVTEKPVPNLMIASRSEFHDALCAAFAEVAGAGCRELWLSDASFADWPLGERAVVESLTQWVHSQRRITLLAETFDEVVRRHPRWVSWRRHWSHVVHCCTKSEREPGRVPTLFLAPGLFSLNIADPIRFRGRLSRDAPDMVLDREALDAVLQHSEAAFPATTTGL